MSKSVPRRFSKILLATDGSPSSQDATEAAAQVAKVFGSEVTILFAVPTFSMPPTPRGGYPPELMRKGEDVVARVGEILRKAGVKSKGEYPQARGSVVETIVEYATEQKVDLIVMGTRGLGGFKRVTLGSVSSAVAVHAPSATLVVRPGKAMVRRILVAIDGSENAQRALEAAIDLAKGLKAELQIGHIAFVPAVSWAAGMPASTVPIYRIEEAAERAGKQLLSKAVRFARDAGVANPGEEMVTKLGSPAQGIVELADKGDADVVVLGTRGLGTFKKLLMGSVANSVLHYANCSVLVVK